MSISTAACARGRIVAVFVILMVTVATTVASLCIGSLSTSPTETLGILVHGYSAHPTPAEVAVLHGRVPRTFVILLVGLALGLAGGLIQGHTRNPLTDPGLLGISAGAAVVIVCGIYFFGLDSTLLRVLLALAGSAIAAFAVFLLGGTGRRSGDPVSLVIAGAAITALLTAVTTTIVLRGTDAMDAFRFWTAGSVAVTDYNAFVPVAPFLAVGAVIALASAQGLNLLGMGEHAATSLGLNVPRLRIVGVVGITLLAGGATAIAGPITFLGLIAPHVARSVVGTDYRWVLPTAALGGTAILFAADILGRVVAGKEVAAGIMLIIVGVPFFLFAIRRTRFTES
ncbi:MAG: iron ABC transporter permease [Gordonia sp. (in: high G+C Gram-positive bacteria)]